MPLSSGVQIEVQVQGTTRVIAIEGELDFSSVSRVQEAIDAALSDRPETVVLDLSGLAFCDSSGIHLVVRSHQRATDNGIRFVAIRPLGSAWRVFEICGINGQVGFVDAHDESSDDGRSPTAGAL